MNGYVLKFLSDSINAAFSRYLTVAFTSLKTRFFEKQGFSSFNHFLAKGKFSSFYQVLILFLNKP